MTETAVLEALRTVIEPVLGVNIVDLGLVYGVRIRDDHVHVDLTLTTPSCPIGEYLSAAARAAILGTIPEARWVVVALVWSPPWGPERISEAVWPTLFRAEELLRRLDPETRASSAIR